MPYVVSSSEKVGVHCTAVRVYGYPPVRGYSCPSRWTKREGKAKNALLMLLLLLLLLLPTCARARGNMRRVNWIAPTSCLVQDTYIGRVTCGLWSDKPCCSPAGRVRVLTGEARMYTRFNKIRTTPRTRTAWIQRIVLLYSTGEKRCCIHCQK